MSTSPHPGTVRVRKKSAAAATQRFLPIAEIRNDAVILKNGGLRAVLEVEALNFNLKSEIEQQAIIAGYGAFMNTLTFPLQIVIRSSKANIDDYIRGIETVGNQQQNPLLKSQTMAYTRFVQRLIEVADIMQKRFLIVVPMDHGMRKKTLPEQFFDWLNPDDTAARATVRRRDFNNGIKTLNERVDVIATGLGAIGLHLTRLSTRDLISLYYEVYNPKIAHVQKLPADPAQLQFDEMTI
jgi:hypothetical protein